MRFHNSIGHSIVAALYAAATLARADAAGSPAPSPVRINVGSAELVRAAGTRLRTQPKRVARLTGRAEVPAPTQHQVVAVKRNGAVDRMGTMCDAHPLMVNEVAGDVTPGGTITLRGACFGASRGEVQMLGRFPEGMVRLPITSWTDTVVVAVIPALSGVSDQVVEIRLAHAAYKLPKPGEQRASPPVVSDSVAMHFAAQRAIAIVPYGWVVKLSCSGTGIHVPDIDDCDSFTTATGAWFSTDDVERIGMHVHAAPTSGEDAWQTRLPAGWTFDHIEFISSSPGTTIAITPTMNNASVQWRVLWKTAHVSDAYGPHEDGSYTMAVFAKGPAGMAKTVPPS